MINYDDAHSLTSLPYSLGYNVKALPTASPATCIVLIRESKNVNLGIHHNNKISNKTVIPILKNLIQRQQNKKFIWNLSTDAINSFGLGSYSHIKM